VHWPLSFREAEVRIVFGENNCRRSYVPTKNSWARSLSAVCSCLARRCRKWLRIAESRVERSASSCVIEVSGLLMGDAAARLPSCSDQVLAACRAVSLSEFMAPAFAEVRRGRSSSVVPGGGFWRKAKRVRNWHPWSPFPCSWLGPIQYDPSAGLLLRFEGDMVYLVLLAGTVSLKEMPCGSSRLEGCLVAPVDVSSADWRNCHSY
jgi:hypothetical protein